MVDFTLFLHGPVDPDMASTPLKHAIESGKLGSFTVDKDYFTVDKDNLTATSATSPISTSTGWYSHICWW